MLEWISIILNFICASGLIGTFLYVKEDKKNKLLTNESVAIQNESSSNEEWQKLYTEKKEENVALCQKIDDLRILLDDLYKLIDEHRDQKALLRIDLMNEKDRIADLREENATLKTTHCVVKKCKLREPPSDY